MYVCIYIYIYMYIHIHIHRHIYIYMRTQTHAHTRTQTDTHTHSTTLQQPHRGMWQTYGLLVTVLPKVSLLRWPVCRSTLPMPSWLSSVDFEACSMGPLVSLVPGLSLGLPKYFSNLPILSARDRRFWTTFDSLRLSDGQSLFEHWSHLPPRKAAGSNLCCGE